jgi:aspartate ammonia-lyase
VRQAQDSLRELGLGGTAVGTGVNTHPRYQSLVVEHLCTVSGQELAATEDMRWTMQSSLPVAVASAALRNYALEFIRICNDLRLLSSGPNTGLGEINLPALQPGSSIMPGKINPVIPELAAMVGFQVVGNDIATSLAVQAGQLELNVMMPTMAWSVLHSGEILKNTTRQLTISCVEGITANQERCQRNAEATVALATALNPYIGYARAAALAKQAVREGRTITELALEQNLLDEEQLKELLDPRRMTEPAPPVPETGKADRNSS